MNRLSLLVPVLFLAAHPLRAQTSLVPPGAHAGAPGTLIQLNDFGSGDIAYFSIPETPPKGGVIVLHDQWGMGDRIKAVVDRLADAGYIAVAPDLFNGQVPADADRAAGMARDLARDSAFRTVAATVRFLRESPRFRCARIVVVGWGMGAGLAWEAAVPGKDKVWINGAAAIGTPAGVDWNELARAPQPLLGLFDPAFPAGFRPALDAALAGRKNVELRDLPAGPPPAQVWPALLAFLDRAMSAPASENFLDRVNPFKPAAQAVPAALPAP